MPIKFEGDILNKLGRHFPTPVIEKVEVYDEKLSITLSIYFDVNEEASKYDLDFAKSLAGLKVYCFYVLGDDANALIKKQRYRIFEELAPSQSQMYLRTGADDTLTQGINANTTSGSPPIGIDSYSDIAALMAAYNEATGQSAVTTDFWLLMDAPNYFSIDISAMIKSTEELYSEEGRPIVQYTTTQDIELVAQGTDLNLSLDNNMFGALTSQSISMTLFAFSSPLTFNAELVNGTSSASKWTINTDNLWQSDWKTTALKSPGFVRWKRCADPVLNKVLYVNEFSDISYEKVLHGSNGEVATDGEAVHVIASGEVFDGMPVRSVKGKYYGDTSITLQTIEEDFMALNKTYEDAAKVNTDLQAVTNSVAYVLTLHKESPELLYELNQYRKAFPKKTGGGALPLYYKAFRQLIASADARVRNGPVISTKLIRNIKVIDYRPFVAPSYVLPAPPIYDRTTDFLYWKKALTSHTVFWATADNEWLGQIHGFVFFDLQKAMRTQSAIAQVFSYDKLESMFGPEILRRFYYMKSAKQIIYHDSNPGQTQITEPIPWGDINDTAPLTSLSDLFTRFEAPTDGQPYVPTVDHMDSNPADALAGIAINNMIPVNEADIGGSEQAYLLLRSFDIPAASPLLDRYDLACLEFQHLYKMPGIAVTGDGDDRALESLMHADYVVKYTFECHDKSRELYEAMSQSYAGLFEGAFGEYYAHATENCNYNNLTQRFNTFFAEAMEAMFVAESVKPWVEMALNYYLHQDLLQNTFAGNVSAIEEAAKVTAEQINPSTGTLSALELFYQKAGEFYDAYYGPDSEIAQTLDAYESTTKHEFGPAAGLLPTPSAAHITSGGGIAEFDIIKVARLVPPGTQAGEAGDNLLDWDLTAPATEGTEGADYWSWAWFGPDRPHHKGILEYNHLGVFSGNTDEGPILKADEPISMSANEWRQRVRKIMSNFQNSMISFGKDRHSSGTEYEQPKKGAYNMKDIRPEIRQFVSNLFYEMRTFSTTSWRDLSASLWLQWPAAQDIVMSPWTSRGNDNDTYGYLASARNGYGQSGYQIDTGHDSLPISDTIHGPGYYIEAATTNVSWIWNEFIENTDIVEGYRTLGNLTGIPSPTGYLFTGANSNRFPVEWSYQSITANDDIYYVLPLYVFAFQQLLALAYSWYHYNDNEYAADWVSNPMTWIFDDWEIPAIQYMSTDDAISSRHMYPNLNLYSALTSTGRWDPDP